MKVSLNWLRDWADPGTDVPALAHALTMAGLEIEGIHRAGPDLTGIVVGEIRSIERHPDAEKLNICRVSTGSEELQIVCGAGNVRVGMKAPLATVGAKLPSGVEIKKAKLRGVDSFGMLCSAKEIGLDADASGLLDLPADARTGDPLVEALALDDTVFEVNLTPNRGDCMSIAGVAREVAATRRVPLSPPVMVAVPAAVQDTFVVRMEGTGCRKFASRVVRGIRAGAKSQFWMQERLRRAGLRPISAVVDVTNYVMLELGQPMHAYDLGRLNGAIIVRFAKQDESLKLLDGRTIALTPDVLVIADERGALAMAGVMGGEDSGISDTTQDVVLEVAFFDPDVVAGRGRRYGLVTDASQRFERGVDPQLQERAIERATELLLQCAGGQAGPTVVTSSAAGYASQGAIEVRHARVQKVLGVALQPAQISDLLTRLGMNVVQSSGAAISVTPPSWRFDIHIEEDLIEEVARLYGFDNIPETPTHAGQSLAQWTETQVRRERAADLLVDRGYHEAITYTFTESSQQAILFPETALAISNPISAELGVMRLSLWTGLLQAVRENQRRQQTRVRLFETGRRFAGDGSETEMVAGVACGPVWSEQWDGVSRNVDFFDVKADVEALFSLTGGTSTVRFVSDRHPALHPGQSARIWRGDRAVGWIGVIHPEHQKRLDLTYAAVVFEIEVEAGLAADIPLFAEISRYPAIRRDIAVIVDEAVHVDALSGSARKAGGELLRGITVLSVYRGKPIEKGKKSIALGLHLQDTSRTLTDDEADATRVRVVESLTRQYNATIRDK